MMHSQAFHNIKKITVGRVERRYTPEIGAYKMVKIHIESKDTNGLALNVDLTCFGDQIEVVYEKESSSKES